MHNSPLKLPDDNTTDIWTIALNPQAEDINKLKSILDNQEQLRYQRLHSKHQHRFLISHAACRQILGQYTTTQPQNLIFEKNEHGKPRLKNHPEIGFNMSHSNDLAIVAVCSNAEIGVDIEYCKEKPSWEKIARRFFNELELNYLLKLPEDRQLIAFFQLWTRKEAYIKAIGTGLSTPLSSFNVSYPEFIETDNNIKNQPVWYQSDLQLNKPYVASVVKNTQLEKIRYYSY